MVGLYETAVDELCGWKLGDQTVKPKIIASTATVRKAQATGEQRLHAARVGVPAARAGRGGQLLLGPAPDRDKPGRRYLGVCSPGSSRPAMLIRVYTAFLTAAQACSIASASLPTRT
jgi:hypothetical protein